MNAIHHWFAQPVALALFGLLPVLGIVTLYAVFRTRRDVTKWTERRAQGPILKRFAILPTLGLALLIVGIAGPQWDQIGDPITAPGRDVVAVLDASRSMLAQDVLGRSSPNRLGRARDSLLELADHVRRRGGHRLGLVVFAGKARVACPLTNDYDHFRDAINHIDADSPFWEIGPTDGAASGTRIGVGLAAAAELMADGARGHGDILLVSDGDDPADDAEWRTGTGQVNMHGIRVIAIGVGNPEIGSPIPTANAIPLVHDGREIMTKLHEEPLQEIARRTGGSYVGAATSAIPMADIFRQYIESRPRRVSVEDVLPVYRQHAGWFFGGAFLFLAVTMLHLGRATQARRLRVGVSLLAGIAISAVAIDDADRAVAEGNAAYERGDFQDANDCYTRAEQRITDPGLVAFNKGAALYRLGRYRDAETHFLRALESADPDRRLRVHYNAGNAILQQVGATNITRLGQAIQHFEQAFALAGDTPLADDIRHNLRVAQERLERAKNAKPPSENDSNNAETRNQDLSRSQTDERPGTDGPGLDPAGDPASRADRASNGAPTDRAPSPGVGNLPVIPDQDELITLSPEDTERYLEQVVHRVTRERLEQRQKRPLPSPNIQDW